jgi:hypothetical protein
MTQIRKANVTVISDGLVHQSPSTRINAPTESTAFRGLFEQTRGAAARSTTSGYLVPLQGLRTTDTHRAQRFPVSLAENNQIIHSDKTRKLSEQMDFKDTATQRATTNQHPNAACFGQTNTSKRQASHRHG